MRNSGSKVRNPGIQSEESGIQREEFGIQSEESGNPRTWSSEFTCQSPEFDCALDSRGIQKWIKLKTWWYVLWFAIAYQHFAMQIRLANFRSLHQGRIAVGPSGIFIEYHRKIRYSYGTRECLISTHNFLFTILLQFLDVNECVIDTNNCYANAVCTNTVFTIFNLH